MLELLGKTVGARTGSFSNDDEDDTDDGGDDKADIVEPPPPLPVDTLCGTGLMGPLVWVV